MAKAFDIMTTQVIRVHPDDKLEDVIKILIKNKISGLPVLDDENKVVGIISDRDLLKYSEKLNEDVNLFDFSTWLLPHKNVPKSSQNKNSEFLQTKVEDIMSKNIVSANENASWHDIIVLMKEYKINRIPIIDAQYQLKGIVTRTDLLNYLAEKED